MKVGVIGVGQAGGRIADLLCYHSKWGSYGRIAPYCLAVNTANADLAGLTTIDKKDKILVGQTKVRGHGVGLRREVGAEVTRRGLHNVMHAITEKSGSYVDGYLIVAGLGGGTGSGGAPVIAQALKEVYNEPVYVLGILPSEDEGSLMAQNARNSLLECFEFADGMLLFDNDIWKSDTASLDRSHEQMNYELIKPLVILLGAGEATSAKNVGGKVVDASDIIASFKGIAFIGYSSVKIKEKGLMPSFIRGRRASIDQIDAALGCCTVVRDAATFRMSGRCNLKACHKALVIISGPPEELSMEGFSEAKAWLQQAIGDGELRGGDYPVRGANELSALVMASAPGLNGGFPIWSERLELNLKQPRSRIRNNGDGDRNENNRTKTGRNGNGHIKTKVGG